jgi:hypothetical protein
MPPVPEPEQEITQIHHPAVNVDIEQEISTTSKVCLNELEAP